MATWTGMEEVGVIGGGQMGSGIAQLAAVGGFSVCLLDSDPKALQRAAAAISSGVRRLVSKGHLSQSIRDPAIGRLRYSMKLEDLRSVDIIIEAIVESETMKKKMFSDLDKIAKPSAILASNTSSISITRLASETSRPSQVIGMHFMNPPPLMKLVEIIRGAQTSDEVFTRVKHLAESYRSNGARYLSLSCDLGSRSVDIGAFVHGLDSGQTAMGGYPWQLPTILVRFGKTVVCSQDFPGFIVNRILMPMINEAFYALYTGVATKEDIDAGMKLGTNIPMGPLRLADFIGLDVCLSIMKVLHNGLGDGRYQACPLLVQYVDAGRLGKKRGVGVYSYKGESRGVTPQSRL